MKKIKRNLQSLHFAFNMLLPFFLLTQGPAFAQAHGKSYLDSLYNTFLYIKGADNVYKNIAPQLENRAFIKCGMPVVAQVQNNFSSFTPEQQSVLKTLLDPFPTDTSIVSPSGRFRIHFNTSGTRMPKYNSTLSAVENARLAAYAFDSSYNYLVNRMNFPPPPADFGAGGDDRYDVYIDNLTREYGYTVRTTETEPGSYKAASYIVVDNDYSGFNTKGEKALEATAAHEFHHAIQFGSYIYRSDEQYYYEAVSTCMEDFVFDDVNDYYFYLSGYFNNTSRPFTRFTEGDDGYDLSIWNIFLSDTLGSGIIKRQLEIITDNNVKTLEAISRSIQERGSDFASMLHEFGIWCFYTGYRAKDSLYFEEGAHYPVIDPMNSFTGTPTVNGSVFPASNSYIQVVNYIGNFPDSLMILLTNSDYATASADPFTPISFNLSLYHNSTSGSSQLNDDYSYNFSTDKPFSWTISAFLDNELLSGASASAYKRNYIFPSPFYYSRHSKIQIGLENADIFAGTYLNVYTSSMQLVYSAQVTPYKNKGDILVEWNVRDNEGKKLPSGVYIYALKSGDNIATGKVVIFSE